jgi:hypothetical protein
MKVKCNVNRYDHLEYGGIYNVLDEIGIIYHLKEFPMYAYLKEDFEIVKEFIPFKVMCIEPCDDLLINKVYTVTNENTEKGWYFISEGLGWWNKSNFVIVNEKENMFTKKDLKSGMIVENNNGSFYLVENNGIELLFVGDRHTIPGSEYTESLLHIPNSLRFYDNKWDIKKIYHSDFKHGIVLALNGNDLTLIWERKPAVKEMTVEQVEEVLGYKVKIVDGK